jgi:hypothetical protein
MVLLRNPSGVGGGVSNHFHQASCEGIRGMSSGEGGRDDKVWVGSFYMCSY